MKKILLIVLTFLISFGAVDVCFAITAADNGKLKIYTTNTGYEGSWLRGFDIQGYVDWKTTPISSTFRNYGYRVFLNVNGNNGEMQGELTGTDITTQLNNMLYTEVGGTQIIDGVSLNVTSQFVNDGEHIKLIYTLMNTTSNDVKISLATTADVQISGDDDATITRLGNGNGILLYTTEEYYTEKPVQFAFYGKGVSGTTAIDSLWIGRWSSDYFVHMFENNPTVTEVQNTDSAFAFAWLNKDIAVGQTQTYSVLMEVGEMNLTTVDLTTEDNAKLYTDNVKIKGVVKDSDLIDTATIHYILDDGSVQTLAPISMNGSAKDFEIDLTSLNLPVGSTHTIKVWATDNLNEKSNEETITFTIKEMRPPQINLITNDWLGEEGKFKLTDDLNVASKVAKYEYKIDDGEWQSVTLETEITAITETGTKIISARTVGVSGEISEVVTKEIKLDKTNPSLNIETTDEGTIKLIGVDSHSGILKVEYFWSEIDQDSTDNADWQVYQNAIKYEGSASGTIYLWTKVTDNAGNIAISKKTINAVLAPTIVTKEEFKDSYAYFSLEDTKNNVNDVNTYQYKINDGTWVNCAKDSEIVLEGLKGEITIYARTVDIANRISEETKQVVKVTFVKKENNGEKDDSPKTGVTSYIEIATFVSLVSFLGLIRIKKENM